MLWWNTLLCIQSRTHGCFASRTCFWSEWSHLSSEAEVESVIAKDLCYSYTTAFHGRDNQMHLTTSPEAGLGLVPPTLPKVSTVAFVPSPAPLLGTEEDVLSDPFSHMPAQRFHRRFPAFACGCFQQMKGCLAGWGLLFLPWAKPGQYTSLLKTEREDPSKRQSENAS